VGGGVHGIEFLDPRHLAPTVDGIVLPEAAPFVSRPYGALAYLEEHGRGFPVGRTVVPHVAGAIIFDLNVGDHRVRPDRAMGLCRVRGRACGSGGGRQRGGGQREQTVGKLYGIARAMRGGLDRARRT